MFQHVKILKFVLAGFTLLFTAAALVRAEEAKYALQPDFLKLPAGQTLGAVSAAAVNSKGEILLFHRGRHPVMIFDRSGNYLRSFGDEWFDSPHGLRVDADDNIWTTDNKNHTVIKFNPDGKMLLKLGERNKPGEDDSHFNKPTDVAVARNGDFFVTDGYGNARVVKFNKEGKFLLAWGKHGKGPGEFNIPHAIRFDSQEMVYVADRENDRIQVFTQEGKFVHAFKGFAPYGLFITPHDELFVADGRANKAYRMDKDGNISASWGGTGAAPGQLNVPHGITVDPAGTVYVTEINGKRIQKFVPNH